MKWIPRSKSGASKSRLRWAAHTRIGNVWEYPPGVYSVNSVEVELFCFVKASSVPLNLHQILAPCVTMLCRLKEIVVILNCGATSVESAKTNLWYDQLSS